MRERMACQTVTIIALVVVLIFTYFTVYFLYIR